MTDCEFCGTAGGVVCCMERMWTDAGKEFEDGTMTQDKMDKLIYCSIEKDGGFQCMDDAPERDVTAPEPIRFDSYRCSKCDLKGNWNEITLHIATHINSDGTYE